MICFKPKKCGVVGVYNYDCHYNTIQMVWRKRQGTRLQRLLVSSLKKVRTLHNNHWIVWGGSLDFNCLQRMLRSLGRPWNPVVNFAFLVLWFHLPADEGMQAVEPGEEEEEEEEDNELVVLDPSHVCMVKT